MIEALDGDLPGRGRAIVEDGISRCAPGGKGNPVPAGKVADRDGTVCGGPIGGVACDGAEGIGGTPCLEGIIGGAFENCGDGAVLNEGDACVGDNIVGINVIFAPGGPDIGGGAGAVGAARFAEILFRVPFDDGIGGGPGLAGCIFGGAGRDGAAGPDESNFGGGGLLGGGGLGGPLGFGASVGLDAA